MSSIFIKDMKISRIISLSYPLFPVDDPYFINKEIPTNVEYYMEINYNNKQELINIDKNTYDQIMLALQKTQ